MHEGVWETRFLFILQPWAFVVVVPIQGRKGDVVAVRTMTTLQKMKWGSR